MHRTIQEWKEYIQNGALDSYFSKMYGDFPREIQVQGKRYQEILDEHHRIFPHDGYVRFFSTPGRTELAGNHTDHNHGRVIAASVQLDALAVVSATANQVVRFFSVDLNRMFEVNLGFLDIHPEEKGTTNALIRGVASWFVSRDKKIGGFDVTVQSKVLRGSGLSSSACIEILLATIFDCLYNNNTVDPVDRALCGKYAENEFFGKPSGLMDQMACSIGGVIGIDFSDPAEPRVTRVSADFYDSGYQLAIVDTKSDHIGGDDKYASIPREMKDVAQQLGAGVLGDVDPTMFWDEFSHLRETLPGRALARAAHFFRENERVDKMIAQLQTKPSNLEPWLVMVEESGNSSYKYLQNVIDDPVHQGYALALLAADSFQSAEGRVVHRVHGGGFGGTIQLYVPLGIWDDFVIWMEKIVGSGCVVPLRVRNYGSIEITGERI